MLLFGEEKSEYDPLISGLEPEPFETVFQELFAGVKTYFAQEEPIKVAVVSSAQSGAPTSPNENAQAPKTAQGAQISVRSRQYPMLRCGACPETFVSQFALEHHETKAHSEFFNWYCAECNVHFETLQLANEHSSMTHGDGEMPVFDGLSIKTRKSGVAAYMQTISKRASDFIRKYFYTRDKRSAMATAYFTYAKCELQAVLAGHVALVLYHQAKTELLAKQNSMEHDDLVHCLKNSFIYGEHIRRVPLITHSPPVTVYRTLSFSQSYAQKQRKSHSSMLRDGGGSEIAQRPQLSHNYDARLALRHSPYTQNHFQTKHLQAGGIRRCVPRVVLPTPQPIRRTVVPQVTLRTDSI